MEPVRRYFAEQAKSCAAMGSPFNAGMCEILPDLLDPATAFGARLLEWRDGAKDDVAPLRACGGLHALARSGRAPELAGVYPPAELDAARLRTAVGRALREHDAFLAGYLDSPPQTNEVARSAIILGGLLHLAQETSLPLQLLEIGSSAGLNLHLDAYHYGLGANRRWGSPDAPLVISSDWRGQPPPDAPFSISSRAGCDLNPLDPGSPADVERLISYVWPDQQLRLDRLQAALRHAARSPIRVEFADAAEWVARQFGLTQAEETCRVLFHTVVWQYLPTETQDRISASLQSAGEAATASRRLAHLAVEGNGKSPAAQVHLTIWPGGETRHLGQAHFHGAWAEWL